MRALVKLEQVLPAHLRRRVSALGVGDDRARRPAGPTVDPQHLTVIAAACRDSERLRFAYRSRDGDRQPARGRAALARQPRAPLVPRRLGPRARGLADVPHRPPRRARPRPACASRARKLPAKDAAAYVEQSIAGAPSRYEARVTLHASAEEIASRVPSYWGHDRADRRATAASTAPATTTSAGSRCGSRCSASTSRCTSRRSWSSTCARWPGSSARRLDAPRRGNVLARGDLLGDAGVRLQRLLPALAGADPVGLLDRQHEDLAVADAPGARGAGSSARRCRRRARTPRTRSSPSVAASSSARPPGSAR